MLNENGEPIKKRHLSVPLVLRISSDKNSHFV